MTDSASTTNEQLEPYFEAVEAQCALRGIESVRLTDAKSGYIGVQLSGATRKWDLYVDCAETSLKLPRLWLGTPRSLLAHVGYGGTVCVDDGQGLSLDPDRRADIVAHTLWAGYDLLEKSAVDAATGMTEFLNELEGYWFGLPNSLRGRAAFKVDGKDRLIAAFENKQTKPPKWYFSEWGEPPPSEFDARKLAALRALYVHLDELPLPPAYPDKLGADFIERVREKFSPAQYELWWKFVGPSKNGPKRLVLLVSVPRAAGGRSLVGVAFSAARAVVDTRADVTPLTLRRHTASYMRERGGASLDLLGKHVAVLGCGAVGSVVADTLAAAGVGRLTLVDHDDYSEDNVFRHVLEPFWSDCPKAIALRIAFERRYPGLQVTPVPSTAQEWFKTADLTKLDGIVVALGMPSVERSFSRFFRGSAKSLPVVFTWLEVLDLGGHSVLTWSSGEGCFDCLYRDDEGRAVLHPRTSFLEPGQRVSRNLTGCVSVFVPFGALQARKTGLMAAEHLLSALNDDPKPSYRFWIGKGTAVAEAGLQTTAWWKAADKTSQAEATRRVFGRPCKRCRSAV